MTREELEKAINFRVVDVPCCGNCKWFERKYEDTSCRHPSCQEDVFSDGECLCPIFCPDEHNVCNLFEENEKDES